jgi:hypothetical protein
MPQDRDSALGEAQGERGSTSTDTRHTSPLHRAVNNSDDQSIPGNDNDIISHSENLHQNTDQSEGNDAGLIASEERSSVADEDTDSATDDLELAGMLSDEEDGLIDHERTRIAKRARLRRERRINGRGGLADVVATPHLNVVPGADLPVVTRLIIDGALILSW